MRRLAPTRMDARKSFSLHFVPKVWIAGNMSVGGLKLWICHMFFESLTLEFVSIWAFLTLSLSWKATEISSFSMSLDFFCHFSASLWSSVAVCTDFASSTQGRYFAQRRHSHGTQIRFVRLPHPCERWSFFQHEQNPRWLLALGMLQLDLRRKQSNIWLQQCFRKSSFWVPPGQVDVRDNY